MSAHVLLNLLNKLNCEAYEAFLLFFLQPVLYIE